MAAVADVGVDARPPKRRRLSSELAPRSCDASTPVQAVAPVTTPHAATRACDVLDIDDQCASLQLRRSWLTSLEDLTDCGSATAALWARARALTDGSDPSSAVTLADDSVRLCDERFLAYTFRDVPECWRRLYTDATLLGAVARMRSGGEIDWRDAVRRLDMALIVAAAPGEGRCEAVHELIAELQRTRLDDVELGSASVPVGDAELRAEAVDMPSVDRPIRRLAPAELDAATLRQLQSSEPFVVAGGAMDWPAIEAWRCPSYLRRIAGPGRVVPVELGRSYTERDWSQAIMPFEDVLDRIGLGGSPATPSDTPLYLAQHDLFRQLPALRGDVLIPDIVYAEPASVPDDYEAPDQEILNAWIGPAGASTPAHTCAVLCLTYIDLAAIPTTTYTLRSSVASGSGSRPPARPPPCSRSAATTMMALTKTRPTSPRRTCRTRRASTSDGPPSPQPIRASPAFAKRSCLSLARPSSSPAISSACRPSGGMRWRRSNLRARSASGACTRTHAPLTSAGTDDAIVSSPRRRGSICRLRRRSSSRASPSDANGTASASAAGGVTRHASTSRQRQQSRYPAAGRELGHVGDLEVLDQLARKPRSAFAT